MDQRTAIKPVPFFLVTGFLGSGKTTLLKRFIETYADGKKLAIIQNEFADINVDGRELKATGKSFELLEINKGSVFCVCLLSDFTSSLIDLLDTCQPDAVILEATGLADPIAIGQLLMADRLKMKTYLSHVWCIIDTTSFLPMETLVTRMVHQVRIADSVVLNKTDQSSAEETQQVEKRITMINPHAEITRTKYCDIDLFDIFKEITATSNSPTNTNNINHLISSGPPNIFSAVVRTTGNIARKDLEQFLSQYEMNTYRIKGYVNLSDNSSVSVQSCFGKTKILSVEKSMSPTELIALGPNLDHRVFSNAFESFL